MPEPGTIKLIEQGTSTHQKLKKLDTYGQAKEFCTKSRCAKIRLWFLWRWGSLFGQREFSPARSANEGRNETTADYAPARFIAIPVIAVEVPVCVFGTSET